MDLVRADPKRAGAEIREFWRWAKRGAAITADTAEAAEFGAFGDESFLAFPQGVIRGESHIEIGRNCWVNEHVTLAAGPIFARPDTPEPIIRLGDDVVLGQHTDIVALHSVVIEDKVWTAPGGIYITDQNHRYDMVDQPIAYQDPQDVHPVRIGAGSVISTHVTVLAGANIGPNTLVAAGAVVRKGDYPSHCVLAGVPARPVRRWTEDAGWHRVAG
ncbi:hypothetical protein GCM10018954_074750 [Kutzneria kofuensis]